MAVLAAHSELGAPLDVLLLTHRRACVVHSNIEQMHSCIVLTIKPTYVRQRPSGFHYDGHSVQGGMPRVEYVSRH